MSSRRVTPGCRRLPRLRGRQARDLPPKQALQFLDLAAIGTAVIFDEPYLEIPRISVTPSQDETVSPVMAGYTDNAGWIVLAIFSIVIWPLLILFGLFAFIGHLLDR